MKTKQVTNLALFAVALAMAAASFVLMILENITSDSYIPIVIILLAIGLFVVAVVGIKKETIK